MEQLCEMESNTEWLKKNSLLVYKTWSKTGKYTYGHVLYNHSVT